MLLASLAVWLVASTASAQIIFSNYSNNPADADYPYSAGLDDTVGIGLGWNHNATDPNNVRYAMPFVNNTGADQPLGTVSLAMYKNPDGRPSNLTIRLIKDNGHGLPSAAPEDILEVLAIDPVITENTESFLDLASSSHPLLLAGVTNWITVETTRYDTNSAAQDVLYYWIQNNSGSKFSLTHNPYGQYSGWLGYYNQDPPNQSLAPTLRVTVFTPTSPALSISLQGSNAVIQWPTNNAAGFRLEAQSTLSANAWAPVSDTPQLNGSFWQVTQPLDSTAKFYHLINP